MSKYQTAMEEIMFDLLSEQAFTVRELEKRMKSLFPGRYSLVTETRDPQDIGRITMLFDDHCEKTEWMLRWG